jgi:hypothetical protein
MGIVFVKTQSEKYIKKKENCIPFFKSQMFLIQLTP